MLYEACVKPFTALCGFYLKLMGSLAAELAKGGMGHRTGATVVEDTVLRYWTDGKSGRRAGEGGMGHRTGATVVEDTVLRYWTDSMAGKECGEWRK